MGGNFSLFEKATIVIRDDIEPESGTPRFEAAEIDMPFMAAEVEGSATDVLDT